MVRNTKCQARYASTHWDLYLWPYNPKN